MKITLITNGKRKEKTLTQDKRIAALIKRMNFNGETFLIKLNGKMAHEETTLKEGDELEFVNVIYGG